MEKKMGVHSAPGSPALTPLQRSHSRPTLSDSLLGPHPRPCRMQEGLGMPSLPGSQCHLERLGRWGDVFPNLIAPLTWIYSPGSPWKLR